MDVEEDGPIPEGWTPSAIGNHPQAPSARSRKGSFFLDAQCHDVWSVTDDVLFVHQAPMLAGQITARVVSLTPTDAWTKAGVMLRESAAPGSRHAMMVVTPGQGSAFQRREHTDQTTLHTPGPAMAAPYWVRLRWSKTEVIASTSRDGKTWQQAGQVFVQWDTPMLPGLCLSGHEAGKMSSTSFDQVKVEAITSSP